MNASKAFLPVAVLVAGVAITVVVVSSKPEPEHATPTPLAPPVEFLVAAPESVQLTISSQGTVQPRTQTTLTAEVSGRIVSISPRFEPGGFFEKGETLLQIDDADIKAALAIEEANLAQAEFNLVQEQALADQARIDWDDLGEGDPTSLALREPQIKQAKAVLASAQARVEKARRDLERSTVKAPYACLIQEKFVDVGGYVTGNPGTKLATVYATDFAEVRLPLSTDELSLIDLPLAFRGERREVGPAVTLTTQFGSAVFAWEGNIIRAEASVDSRSRLIYVVAAVDNPYGRNRENPQRPPLRAGLFVEATIEGRNLPEAYVIPRFALREGNTVLVAAPDDTLQRKAVTVAQALEDVAIVTEGLAPGDRVITSPVEYAVEGMAITPEGSQGSRVEGQESDSSDVDHAKTNQ